MKIKDCRKGMLVLATKKSVCDMDSIVYDCANDKFETFLKDCPFGICRILEITKCSKGIKKGTIIKVEPPTWNKGLLNKLTNGSTHYCYCFRAGDLREIKEGYE